MEDYKYRYYVVLMGMPKINSSTMYYTDYWCEYNEPLESKEKITNLLNKVKQDNNLSSCFIINMIRLKE